MVPAVAAAVFVLAPRVALADDDFPPRVLLWTAPLVDTAFFAFDAWAAANERPMPVGVAAAELGLGITQCAGGSLIFAFSTSSDVSVSDPEAPSWLPLAILPSAAMGCAMYAHGVFGVVDHIDQSEEVPAADRFLISAIVGLNTPFTMAAMGGFLGGYWPRPIVAAPQVAIAAAGFAVSAHRAATEEPLCWTGAAWSAFNLVHGIVALAKAEDEDDAPVPDYAVVPTMMESNGGSAPGLVLTGAW
jgi:hypothetical protein